MYHAYCHMVERGRLMLPRGLLTNYFWWLVAWYMDGAAELKCVGREGEWVSAAGGICSGDLWPPQSTVQWLPWELLCLVRGD